jgi:hypothetical protein
MHLNVRVRLPVVLIAVKPFFCLSQAWNVRSTFPARQPKTEVSSQPKLCVRVSPHSEATETHKHFAMAATS